MIGGTEASIVKGVYCDKGELKVTLPLLFTKIVEYCAPKKLATNGSVTIALEPSSFAGRLFAVQPVASSTALPGSAEAAGSKTNHVATKLKTTTTIATT